MRNQTSKHWQNHPIPILLLAVVALALPLWAADQADQVKVPAGQKTEIRGVIIERAPEGVVVRDYQGFEYTVLMKHETEIAEGKKNPFRKALRYSREDLLPGLNVEVDGTGDDGGRLMAEEIKFTQNDLKVAKTIAARAEPVEGDLASTRSRLEVVEQKSTVLSNEIEELEAAYQTTREELKTVKEDVTKVRQTAQVAISDVEKTNQRISGLDQYEAGKEAVVEFKFDSAELTPEAQAMLDEVGEQAQQNQAFLIEIRGFASADGEDSYNQKLSQRRAHAVADYLAVKHMIPLRRITIPMGYGAMHPVADNETLEGRKKNRRVEVRMLVNHALLTNIEISSTDSPKASEQVSVNR